jgi:fatty-acyl-CoA synthase
METDMGSIFDQDLPRNPANFAPLSPLSFLERSAEVYPDRLAVVHGSLRRTWSELYARCRQLASTLARHGIAKGDTVAVMLPNTPPMVEAHFGIPMAGAVLNALNTRLDPAAVAFMLDHGEAKVVIVDPEFTGVMAKALELRESRSPLLVIDVEDALYTGEVRRIGSLRYDEFVAQGDPQFAWELPADEWDAIALNYTSGTTGNPKGVVYHHRGAATNAISNILEWDMPKHAVYLWTLPMFHCNGWCFPWTVAARAGVRPSARMA